MVSLDSEPVVRLYFVEKFANIFLQCQKHASPDLEYYLNDLLLDIIVKYLYEGSNDNEVKQQAFINLIQIIGILSTNKKKIEEKIFPAILDLSKNTDYETNGELNLMAIRLMGRTACIIGPEKTKELIIDRFLEYCSFRMDIFRKTCASVFPSICYAMGVEYTEEYLLDHFFKLCKDGFWGVRKACAGIITSLSLLCSLKCRKERIAPVVLDLANDDSKWVVCITLKKLGPFISTFAEPCLTGLYFSDFGELHLISPTDEEFEVQASQELLANYQYYLEKFSETGAQHATNNCQRRCYKDALSPEQIAQRIIENKTKLFEQVNYDTYLRTRMYSCLDVDSSLQVNTTDGESATTPLDESEGLGDNKDVSILLDTFTEATNEDVDVSDKTEDKKEESPCDLVENTTHNSAGEESVKKVGELHTKNRRIVGPSDLSGIIKKAIGQAQEGNKSKILLPPPPSLLRQTSREDISARTIDEEQESNKSTILLPPAPPLLRQTSREDISASCNDLSLKTPAEEKSADVVHADFMDSLIQEWENFSKKDVDTKVLAAFSDDAADQDKGGDLVDTAKKSRRSGIHQPLSNLQQDTSLNGSSKGDKETAGSMLNKTYAAFANYHDKSNEDDDFTEFNSHKYRYISPDLSLAISQKLPTDFQQDIVPPGILKAYVNMVLHFDEEGINLNCAQHFPAVALTIGRENWHLLKALLECLCDDLDWKVRKTIASYIDLLAMILGREIASEDLLPIYVDFFKDLDEVKIRAIKNAANFLKVIDHKKHEDVLSRIGDCLRVDSKTNWRIKEDLAKQVLLLIRMYNFVDKEDNFLYITSLTALFLEDKISCVREIAADAMVEIIRIANSTELEGIVQLFLVKEFARSETWRKRQTFLSTLLKLIKCDQPPTDVFRLVFSSVRDLSHDAVPNVRLLVAKCLYELTRLDEKVFKLRDFEEVASAVEIIKRLQVDADRDVRDTLSGIEQSTLLELGGSVESYGGVSGEEQFLAQRSLLEPLELFECRPTEQQHRTQLEQEKSLEVAGGQDQQQKPALELEDQQHQKQKSLESQQLELFELQLEPQQQPLQESDQLHEKKALEQLEDQQQQSQAEQNHQEQKSLESHQLQQQQPLEEPEQQQKVLEQLENQHQQLLAMQPLQQQRHSLLDQPLEEQQWRQPSIQLQEQLLGQCEPLIRPQYNQHQQQTSEEQQEPLLGQSEQQRQLQKPLRQTVDQPLEQSEQERQLHELLRQSEEQQKSLQHHQQKSLGLSEQQRQFEEPLTQPEGQQQHQIQPLEQSEQERELQELLRQSKVQQKSLQQQQQPLRLLQEPFKQPQNQLESLEQLEQERQLQELLRLPEEQQEQQQQSSELSEQQWHAQEPLKELERQRQEEQTAAPVSGAMDAPFAATSADDVEVKLRGAVISESQT